MDRIDEFEANVERLIEYEYSDISFEDISESLRYLSREYLNKYNRQRIES